MRCSSLPFSLWASTFIVTKDAFTHFNVMAFVFVRFGLMIAMAFAILAVIRARNSATRTLPERADLFRYLGAGLAGFTVYQLGFNLGLDRTSIFSASLLISTSPLFTILILTLIGERPPAAAWIGVAVAVIGVAIFLSEKQGGEHSAAGDLLCIMAAIAFGVYGVINRPLVARAIQPPPTPPGPCCLAAFRSCWPRFPRLAIRTGAT
ncbi:MAG: DMT family transporter [Thermomicrobiales bacterium]